ncbi:MAG: 6-phosphofructokinase [Nitrospinota bacterium]
MRIGVLTGGGDCPGLNAVIMSIVKVGIRSFNDQIIGIQDGFEGLVKNKMTKLDLDKIRGILSRGGTILGSSNKYDPFRCQEKIDGVTTFIDRSDKAVENYKTNGIECLIVVGGDGSLVIADKFAKKGLNVIGIPKTIDNDLSVTDITFGFDTTINTVMEAIDRIQTTAKSHHRIMVVEVMGRDAGWIALYAGIAGGAHVILIPEIDFNFNTIVDKIYERKGDDKHFTVLVVAEGAKEGGSDQIVKRHVDEAPDSRRLGGIGDYVARELEARTSIESRCTALGHIQRGGSPSAFDRVLSCRYGAAGVKFAHAGKFDHMVALQTPNIVAVPIKEALKQIKTITPTSDLINTAKQIGINFGV